MDAALVDKVVQQVIAALRQQGLAVGAAQPSPSPSTGGKPQAAKGYHPQAAVRLGVQTRPKAAKPEAPAAPRKVFVTADMLAQRLALNGHGGTIDLAHNEFLTPNAKDLADRKHLTVRKAVAPPAIKPAAQAAELPVAPAPAAAGASCATFGIVVDGGGPNVESLLKVMAHDSLPLADYSRTACWMANTQEMCRAIAAGQLAGGVAILPHAADAMVLANKFRGIRAVQGTRSASVEAAIRHFGANVLIVEHAFSTFHEMRQMVRLFAAQRQTQAAAGALMAAVSEMER